MSDLSQIVFFLLALVLSISVHEFSHAWSAYELGDGTARSLGRLTLNPIKHFDPIGALMILFMAFAGWGIGWGKPVPVNPYNLRTNPRVGMGLTAAAGPFSNLVMAALFAIPLRLALGDEDWLNAQTQAQTDDTAEKASGVAKATELTAIIELRHLRQAQVLPSVRQEAQDTVHAATVNEFHIDGLVKDILADQKVVTGRISLQIARPDYVDLVQMVGVSRLRP